MSIQTSANPPGGAGERSFKRVYAGGAAAVALALAGVGVLYAVKASREHTEAASRSAAVDAGPKVLVAAATRSPAEKTLNLQGEARAYATVTLYAKVSGYLKKISVDKGDKVKEGQIIAVIESPELDRQYDSAVADARNKRAESRRTEALVGPGVVSAREAEMARTSAEMAESNVSALATQKSYEILKAPFTGTVTARFADPGALVQNATSSQTAALPLVTITQPDKLRIYTYVDQKYAAFVKIGDPAEIRLTEQPGVVLKGTIARASQDLDPRTRTMLTEVELDNREGKIVSGSFVQVSLKVKTPSLVQIPAAALVLRAKATFVAAVTADNKVTFKPVAVADQDGDTVRLASGLDAGERVALNLGDSVPEGQVVRPFEAGAPSAKPGH